MWPEDDQRVVDRYFFSLKTSIKIKNGNNKSNKSNKAKNNGCCKRKQSTKQVGSGHNNFFTERLIALEQRPVIAESRDPILVSGVDKIKTG